MVAQGRGLWIIFQFVFCQIYLLRRFFLEDRNIPVPQRMAARSEMISIAQGWAPMQIGTDNFVNGRMLSEETAVEALPS